MKVKFISLGSFCHPKIFLRNENIDVLESLPFDFHSSPNTYSIYHILKQLAHTKKVHHDFVEILYEHEFNSEKETQLAIRDSFDMYFLHFFNTHDLKIKPEHYPCTIDYVHETKIKEVQQKFDKRYERLYNILHNKDDILIFLRIENYENPCWEQDVKNLVDSIQLFHHPNAFLIYSQINVRRDLDYFISGKLNFDHKIPILFHKYMFNESISHNPDEYDKFKKLVGSFQNIVKACIILNIKDQNTPFYYDSVNNLLVKLNDIHVIYQIKNIDEKYIHVIYKDEHLVFLKNNEDVYVCVS